MACNFIWNTGPWLRAAGEHPVETFLHMADKSDGEALFTVRFFNQNEEALRRVLSYDFVIPGLGDAGAHVSQIMDQGGRPLC